MTSGIPANQPGGGIVFPGIRISRLGPKIQSDYPGGNFCQFLPEFRGDLPTDDEQAQLNGKDWIRPGRGQTG